MPPVCTAMMSTFTTTVKSYNVGHTRAEVEGVPDVVTLDGGREGGIELADEAAAERQIDELEPEIVVGLDVEAQPAGDVLRVARGVREGEGRGLSIGPHAADTARPLARIEREDERADEQDCGTPSDN